MEEVTFIGEDRNLSVSAGVRKEVRVLALSLTLFFGGGTEVELFRTGFINSD